MILMVSGRTDIVAFYSKWFMKRYDDGFVDVRSPFRDDLVNRIYFKDVDAILFCTKNPLPILDSIKRIDKPILFHVTLTPYKEDIEPNVISKKDVIEGIKKLSSLLGVDRVVVRYDPILLNNKYDVTYHKKAFEKVCKLLDGYVKKIIVSFIDDCKNVRNHTNDLRLRKFTDDDYREIGLSFSKSASLHGMSVQTCFEEHDLVQYGFVRGECMSHELAYQLTGKAYSDWKARKENLCHCVQMVDMGAYNSCKHLCKYCYANFNENEINKNISNHFDDSSLLIGRLRGDDVVKVRYK